MSIYDFIQMLKETGAEWKKKNDKKIKRILENEVKENPLSHLATLIDSIGQFRISFQLHSSKNVMNPLIN